MKILTLRFNHINSLSTNNPGGFEIDFQNPTFTNSGLFAITGPNGAGKSTLLESICLAIYGESNRYKDKKSGTPVSHGQYKAWTEVEIDIEGTIYRFRYDMSLSKKDRSPQPSKHQIHKGEQIIAEKTREVEALRSEILKLNYDQFMRSVMLAQGAFEAFLTSNKNEKTELLSDITGGQIYSDLSIHAYEKAKIEKQKLDDIKKDLSYLKILSDEEINSYKLEIIEIERENLKSENDIKYLDDLKIWLEKKVNQQRELQKLTIESKDLDEKYQNLENERNKLIAHDEAKEFNPNIKTIDQIKDDLNIVTKLISDTQKKISPLEMEIQTSRDLVTKSKNNLELINKNTLDARPKISKSIVLLTEVNELNKKKQELTEIYKAKNNEITEIENEITALTQKKTTLNEANIRYNHYLTNEITHKELAGASSGLQKEAEIFYKLEIEISTKQKDTQELKNQLEKKEKEFQKLKKEKDENEKEFQQLLTEIERRENEKKNFFSDEQTMLSGEEKLGLLNNQIPVGDKIYDLLNAHEKSSESIEKLNSAILKIENELPAFIQDIQRTEKEIEQEKLLLEKNTLIREKDILIQKYEVDRQKLKDNEPCYLCGAVHHPYTINLPESEISEIEREITRNKMNINAYEIKLKDLSEKSNGLSNNLKSLKNQLDEKNLDLNQLKEKLIGIENSWKIKIDIWQKTEIINWLNNAKLEKDSLDNQIKSYKEIGRKNAENQNKSSVLKDQIQAREVNLLTLKTQNEGLAKDLENISAEVNKIISQKNGAEETLRNAIAYYKISFPASSEISNWGEKLKKLNEKYQETEEKLKQNSLDLQKISSESEKHAESKNRLTEDKNKIVNDGKKVAEELKVREGKIIELIGNKTPEEFQKQLEDSEAKGLEQLKKVEEILNEKIINMTELSAKLNAEEERFNDLKHKHEKNTNELLALILPKGIDSVEELKKRILDSPQADKIREILSELKEKKLQNQTLIQESEEKLKNLTAEREDTNITISDILKQIPSLREGINVRQQRKGFLEQEQKNNALNLVKANEIKSKIQAQEKTHSHWKELSDLIGSAKGDKFSTYAQNITLNILVDYANYHLQKLSKRYQIHRDEKDTENLTLQIMDKNQGDVTRPVTSMSGGEKFLVCLSLALGLSDLSSNRQKIETLFIDEGFGSLDPRNLDIAMDLLENLQSSGRLVGIISHVESMTDRIPVKIEIIPGSGISKIRLPYE